MVIAERETIQLLLIEDNADDAAIIRRLLSRYEGADLRVHSVGSTREGVERLRNNGFDLLLVDYQLPGEDGIEFVRRLSARQDVPPVIVLTGHGDERLAVEAMRSGAYNYFSKEGASPDMLGEAIREALQRFRSTEDRHRSDEQLIFMLTKAAAERDSTTGQHLQRIGSYAVRLGRALWLDAHELVVVRYGALLHDIGKIAVSDRILRKPSSLTEEEWEEIRHHPVIGERICSSLALARDIGPIIRHHHERWDGTGYIDGLAGEVIPLHARIVAVADAFDAMCSNRPYRRALPVEGAIRQLELGAGKQWDPRLIEAFVDLIEREGPDLDTRAVWPRRRAA